MLNYKEETTDVLYQTAGLIYDYSEKSIAIYDSNTGSFVLYPKSKIVVNHDNEMFATINNVYQDSLEFTQRNFHYSYFQNMNKEVFSYENCLNKVETVEEVVEETIEEVVEKTNSFLAALLIKEIQFEQSKEELTDEEALEFERCCDHLINEQSPFHYKGLKITSLQVSDGLVIGHYFSKTLNFWQTVIIEKLG